jgi:SPP1 family predicted phage head-tail adaptor
LERPVDTPDGAGGATRTWTAVGEVWGHIAALGGSETIASDRGAQRLSHRITIRWRGDVTGEMRLRSAGRTFSILVVLDPEDRKRFLECLTQEEIP